jgi:hypothetical protein
VQAMAVWYTASSCSIPMQTIRVRIIALIYPIAI